MKPTLIIILVTCVYSCTSKETPSKKENTPAPLQEKTSSDEIFSKRGPDDLVESLFDELIKKDAQLKELDDFITSVPKHRDDSLNAFLNFKEKNEDYYLSAQRHLNGITDSTLKKSIEELVNKSLNNNYQNNIVPAAKLSEIIDNKYRKLLDLYAVLKLTRTLTVMNDYQQANKASITPLENRNREFDAFISKTEKLLKN